LRGGGNIPAPRYFHQHFQVNTDTVNTAYDSSWTCPYDDVVLDHIEVGTLDPIEVAVLVQHVRNGFEASIGSGMIVGGLGIDNHYVLHSSIPLAAHDVILVRVLFPSAVAVIDVDMMMHREGR